MYDDSTNDRTDSDYTTADARQRQTRGREARVSRDPDGDPMGAAVWLNADELAALGADVDTADAVAYRVVDTDLHVDAVRGSDE